jgi:hypothetical protein
VNAAPVNAAPVHPAPARRRLAVLCGALALAVAGGAYVTWGAEPVDAAPAPAAPAVPARPTGVPAVPDRRPAAAPAAPAAPDTIVVEREVYGYDGGGRRDPFRPLIVTTVLRPFASELRLVAVAYDPAGARSVAILRDQTTRTQHRVRAGQLVGRMRVVRIQPRAVVFSVEELGFSRRETLTLNDSTGSRPQP